jgi:hypothetical protein
MVQALKKPRSKCAGDNSFRERGKRPSGSEHLLRFSYKCKLRLFSKIDKNKIFQIDEDFRKHFSLSEGVL